MWLRAVCCYVCVLDMKTAREKPPKIGRKRSTLHASVATTQATRKLHIYAELDGKCICTPEYAKQIWINNITMNVFSVLMSIEVIATYSGRYIISLLHGMTWHGMAWYRLCSTHMCRMWEPSALSDERPNFKNAVQRFMKEAKLAATRNDYCIIMGFRESWTKK